MCNGCAPASLHPQGPLRPPLPGTHPSKSRPPGPGRGQGLLGAPGGACPAVEDKGSPQVPAQARGGSQSSAGSQALGGGCGRGACPAAGQAWPEGDVPLKPGWTSSPRGAVNSPCCQAVGARQTRRIPTLGAPPGAPASDSQPLPGRATRRPSRDRKGLAFWLASLSISQLFPKAALICTLPVRRAGVGAPANSGSGKATLRGQSARSSWGILLCTQLSGLREWGEQRDSYLLSVCSHLALCSVFYLRAM